MEIEINMHHVDNDRTGMCYQLMTVHYKILGVVIWSKLTFIDSQPPKPKRGRPSKK
jgi:hypothetical protein